MMLVSEPRCLTTRRYAQITAALLVLVLVSISVYSAMAAPPGNDAFQRTWQRTDRPVLDGLTARTWMWGPQANTNVLQEPYAEAPGSSRDVQYFDKARMEITTPDGDASSIWYVTNGLLVVEMTTGNVQTGDATFEQRAPAQVTVAGDADDPTGPTYATFGALLDSAPLAPGATITQRVDRNATVTDDPALSSQGVTAAVVDDVTNHAIATPFWDFMNSSGTVYEDGQFTDNLLFENPYFATGRPITEAYWSNVKVGGTYRDVLMQCFERRCLTYTPGNPAGFIVEAGNVGQHYYSWRYGQQPVESTPTATAPGSATPSTSATQTATPTMTATETASPTATMTATATEAPVTEYSYLSQWGKPYVDVTPFDNPTGMSVDNDGNFWVVDSRNYRLVEFDKYGIFLRTLGESGFGVDQFQYPPSDVAFGDDGRMYVSVYLADKVMIFGTDGTYQKSFGDSGTTDGLFDGPLGVAVHDGVVYVSDTDNHRIQMFDLAGTYRGQFGSEGSGNGQFKGQNRLSFSPDGELYAVDASNHRVQVFTSAGDYLSQFGSEGSGDGQFDHPYGITIDGSGFIYIADGDNDRIQKFDQNGNYLLQWGTTGTGFGQFRAPSDLAVDDEGNVFVTDRAHNRIEKFTNNGAFLFDCYDASRGTFGNLSDITLDQNGNLLTVDRNKISYDAGSISRYSPDGIPLDVLSRSRPDSGQYDQLTGVAVNQDTGDIYVTDSFSNRVQRFSTSWQYKGQWGAAGTEPGQFSDPTAIAIDADGNVYVADTGNNRIQKFDANGVFLKLWGGVGDGDGQLKQPAGIVIDGERVYVSDYGNDRVEVFDREGTYLGRFGSTGTELGNLDGPVGLAVTPDGYLLVVDSNNNRVQIFSPEGEALGAFGSPGSDLGQFNLPWGIAADDQGDVYVTDISNYRVQKFSPVG